MSEIEIKAYKHVESIEPDLVHGGHLYYGHQVREAYLAGAAAVAIPPAVREAAVRLREWHKDHSDEPHEWDTLDNIDLHTAKVNSILLLCQHVLGSNSGAE